MAPIPAIDNFTVSALSNNITFKNLKIFSIYGKEIFIVEKNKFSLASTSVDVSEFANGTYILGIETELGYVFKQIFIKT